MGPVSLCLLTGAAAQSTQQLTTETIIEMHKSRVATDVLKMINSSNKSFNLRPSDLIKLTNEKLPQTVIRAIWHPKPDATSGSTPPHSAYLDSNDPPDSHSPGICVLTGGAQPKMVKLQPARA